MWGNNGLSPVIGFDGYNTHLCSMAFDGAGRVVVAGGVGPVSGSGPQFMALARFQNDAPLYANLYGTIMTANGMRIKNATVVLSEGELSQPVYALSNQFGNYAFTNLPVTENYSVSISSKRFSFSVDQKRVILNHDEQSVDFTALLDTEKAR